MKEVTFTGSLSAVVEKENNWKAENPRAKIVDRRGPVSEANYARPGQDVTEEPNWSLTLKYEG